MSLDDDVASLEAGVHYDDVSGEAEKATEKLNETSESLDVKNDDDSYGLLITSMYHQVGNKFLWVINYPSLMLCIAEQCYSSPFEIRGVKWHVVVYFDPDFFNLDLRVAESQPLPSEALKVRLKLVNQISKKLSISKDSEHCFTKKSPTWGFHIPSGVFTEDSGFLVDGELVIVAEVCGVSDVADESTPQRKLVEDNGFYVLPSQVQSVRFIFERQPDVVEAFRSKNQHLRTTYMNFLLGFNEALYQPIQEISNEDLVEADKAISYFKDVGFKVDWLEKKLEQVKENKEKELSCEASSARSGGTA
ncbi:unnamed protein product [Microthlaspi erraticum]|uniref:MATH domain-containing protein n=1 Tax=Microthlaspi erraticum TaxID=1685480 RepID=A0A6D2LKD0_9BRAS|nr:unnamed protein product [Microthlaspi erraticum]